MFKLQIETANDAFENLEDEIARILREVAGRIAGKGESSGPIFDANGNQVGDFEIGRDRGEIVGFRYFKDHAGALMQRATIRAGERFGTSCFPTVESAERYYRYGYDRGAVAKKIAEGEVTIGAPKVEAGQRAYVHPQEGRYFVEWLGVEEEPRKEVLVHAAAQFSYNWPDGDPRHGKEGREVVNEAYLDAKEAGVGSRSTIWAGAPGTGRAVYEITRIDNSGAYGVEVENTIRELTPAEVR